MYTEMGYDCVELKDKYIQRAVEYKIARRVEKRTTVTATGMRQEINSIPTARKMSANICTTQPTSV